MKVKVLHPLKHDGERFGPGDVLELPAETARQLMDAGAVERADLAGQAAANKATAKKATGK